MNGRGAPTIAFAGGGTAGHLYPALAVAEALRGEIPDIRIVFFTTSRPIDDAVLGGRGSCRASPSAEAQNERIISLPQPVSSWRKAPWTWPRFVRDWRASMRLCRAGLRAHRPIIVIGSGGYASMPPLFAARDLGIPTALLNPDAIPGRANRHLGPQADLIFAQWEDTRRYFPRHRGFCETGCPVRPEFRMADRQRGLARFGLDPARQTVVVTGASQGARTINDAVLAMIREIVGIARWQVLHLTGKADAQRVLRAYRGALKADAVAGDPDELSVPHPLQKDARDGAPVPGPAAVRVVGYTEHMADALAAADLVIARAGASTLAELMALGRASILMPYPFGRDQHQLANARVLVRAGAARLVRDRIHAADNVTALRSVLLPLLNDRCALERMSAAARRIGTADAASDIAERVLECACGGAHVAPGALPNAVRRSAARAGGTPAPQTGEMRRAPPGTLAFRTAAIPERD